MAEIDLNKVYDAVVVGSGAAGGLAAHVLTTHGLDVLLLEAGARLNFERASAVRLTPARTNRTRFTPTSRAATNPITPGTFWLMSASTPTTGTPYPWVRARCLGGKTNIWGQLALRLSDYDFKARSHDGYGEDWPLSYADLEPCYEKVDLYLGISGQKEDLPHLPDSLFQRPIRLTDAEVRMRRALRGMGRVLTPYRAGVTTDGLKHIPQPLLRARLAQGRLRYPRGVRFAHRIDRAGDGYRPTPAAYRIRGLRSPMESGKARGVSGRAPSCWGLPRSNRRACCCSR